MYRFARHTALATLAAVSLLTATARQLTPDEALAALRGNSEAMRAPAAGGLQQYTLRSTITDGDLATVYIFSRGADGGYAVVSADDIATPLLGYSDSGSLDADNLPPAMSAWLEGYSRLIAYAARTGARVSAAPAPASRPDVAPILTTTWNQDSPYNDLCPTYGNQRCVTGCAATAIAQVLNSYRWPETGQGTDSYKWETGNRTITYNFGNTTFDWDNMLDSYGVRATDAQRNAVATLMYACGVAAHMNYHPDGSGATSFAVANGLIDHLRYDRSLKYAFRDYYTVTEWTDMLLAELTAGRPVYYGGVTANQEGHAFVFDGYRQSDGYFHVNWGWGGVSDGYFAMATLDPGLQGIGGGSAGFAYMQDAFFGLKKAEADSKYNTECYLEGGLVPSSTSIRRSSYYFTFNSSTGLYNYSLTDRNVQYGFKLTSLADNSVRYIYWQFDSYDFPTLSGLKGNGLYFACNDFPPSGSWKMEPIVSCEGEIVPVHVENGTPASLIVTCSSSTLTFASPAMAYSFTAGRTRQLCPAVPGHSIEIAIDITNTGDLEATDIAMLSGFFYGSDRTPVTLRGTATIAPGETSTVTFTGEIPDDVPVGTYELVLQYFENDERKSINLGSASIVIEKYAQATISDIVFDGNVAGRGSMIRPYLIDLQPLHVTYTLTATASDCTGLDCIQVIDTNYAPVILETRALSLQAGESEQYEWTCTLDPTKTYLVRLAPGLNVNDTMYLDNYFNGQEIYVRQATDGINDATATTACTVYPNPAETTVTITAPAAVIGYEIYSLGGATLMRIATDGTTDTVDADISALAPGMYILRVTTAEQTYTTRLIKK